MDLCLNAAAKGVPYVRSLIRLGWSQLAIVAAGLATVLAVVWFLSPAGWDDLYARKFGLPRIQERYGFEFGTVSFTRGSVTYAWPGIVSVSPNGELAKMGVRPRDFVWEHHGQGAAVLYSALIAGERGEAGEFDVVNADVIFTNREELRTIRVPPRRR